MKYCDYCNINNGIKKDLMNQIGLGHGPIESNHLILNIQNNNDLQVEVRVEVEKNKYGYSLYREINFCPMCGRKLNKK